MKVKLLARQLFISVLLGVLPFFLINIVFSDYSSELSRKEWRRTTGYHLQSVSQSLENVITSFEEATKWIIGNEAIRDYMKDPGTDIAVHQSLYARATTQMFMIPYNTNAFYVISVFRNDGEHIDSGSRSREALAVSGEEKEKAEALRGSWFWTRNGDKIAVCRLFRNPENLQQRLGYIKLQMDVENILKSPLGEETSEFYALLDEEGDILYTNYPTGLDGTLKAEDLQRLMAGEDLTIRIRQEKGSREISLTSQEIEGKRTRVVCIRSGHSSLVDSYWHTLFLVSISLAVIIWVLQIWLTNRWMIQPLKKLGKLMGKVEEENYSVRFHVRGRDEIGELGNHFNKMCDRLQALYEEAYRSNLILKDAEIMALQAEINPHFMFNTLDTIYWMVYMEKNKEAMDMIHALSESFRMTLYRTKDGFITLKMAVEQVENYLYIQKTRLQDKLLYSIEIEEELDPARVRVMHMVLQPLVENAIHHGISSEGSGEVLIMIYRQEDTLIYHIYDSGTHADEEKIRRALEESPEGTTGLALYNIQSRIRLKFGPEYGVTYIHPEDGGSIFLVRQPYAETRGEEATEEAQ